MEQAACALWQASVLHMVWFSAAHICLYSKDFDFENKQMVCDSDGIFNVNFALYAHEADDANDL